MSEYKIAGKVVQALLQLGLTEKEAAVYVALLEKGASSVQDTSRFSGINRVTIYAAIDELKRKGLVAESKKGKRTLFVAENPENLQSILDSKKEKLRHQEKTLSAFVIPTLSAININQQDKPEIQYFEGAESMSRVFDNYVLRHKNIIACGSYEAASVAINWEEEAKFLREIQRRKILYRVILRDTDTDQKMAEKYQGLFSCQIS